MNPFFLLLSVFALCSTLSATAAVIAGPITNSANGHLYYLLSTNRWTVSEAEAQSLGGHLVTIDDQEEHDWVCSTFANYGNEPRHLWIGLTDREEEGVFRWVTGEPLTFSKWCPEEPNDTDGNEDYVHIFEPFDFLDRGLTWNDSADLLFFAEYPVYGVVEVSPTVIPIASSIQRAVAIQWASEATKIYQVQWTTELNEHPIWSNLGTAVQGDDSVKSVFEIPHPTVPRFYRVVELR